MIRALNVDKLRLDTGDYILSVQALSKSVRGRTVLTCVDLDVKRGGFTALVGPSGAGKSLTLACIAGFRRPTRGRVRYFGYEIRGRRPESVVRLGIVRAAAPPQPLGGMTALESVTLGALLRRPRLARARDHAREVLVLTGLAECGDAVFAALGDLDRRRLELARALATEPQLLLLDDLFAGLDAHAAAELGAVLGEVRTRGVTLVAAARTLEEIAPTPDDVVAIDRGRTAEIGAHASVNVYARR